MVDSFKVAADLIGRTNAKESNAELRKFFSLFGTSLSVCSRLWDELHLKLPENYAPHYLLWGLMFLKNYGTETFNSSLAGCDPKTFRKYQWITVNALADLKLVS